MKMNFGLHLEQSQKLVLTPELRQAIEILQYNSLELVDHIKQEMEENPLLEGQLDFDMDLVRKDARTAPNQYSFEQSEEQPDQFSFIPSRDTLVDHLKFQMQLTYLPPKDLEVVEYLIDNIDENGYLDVDTALLCERFSINEDDLEELIQIVQTFEPHGVGARDLEECLLIQLSYMEEVDERLFTLVNNHLQDIGQNKLLKIADEMSIDIKTIQLLVDQVKRLEPKPGRAYSDAKDLKYIRPDVTLKTDKDGHHILINESSAPKLNISTFYANMMKEGALDEEASKYIKEKLMKALKLIRSIEQRKSTIYKVVSAILVHQAGFFDGGKDQLKPLTLKEIADEIGVHESTVSRATNGKYLQCAQGLFELKYFFQSGVKSIAGDGVSAQTIKIAIIKLIEEEDPKKPLSDQQLSSKLNLMGIKVSRRTVAKYRDELHILSSSRRKRF